MIELRKKVKDQKRVPGRYLVYLVKQELEKEPSKGSRKTDAEPNPGCSATSSTDKRGLIGRGIATEYPSGPGACPSR
jgi:hypothetical protein